MTSPQKKQQGIALLMLVFVLALATISLAVNFLNSSDVENAKNKMTINALVEAKNTLLGYAMTYDDTHIGEVFGYFPCPDTNDVNGPGSQLVCGNAGESAIGRLPWKTLKVSPIKDGYGECLWYAVSGVYKNNPKQPLIPTTLGQLRVRAADGSFYLSSDIDPVVAIVFAPGSVVGAQDRTDSGEDGYCGGNYNAANYLDTSNSISNSDITDTTFVIDNSATFNDQLILIRRSEVFENYCGKYSRQLANQVDLITNSNACDNTGSVSAECQVLRDNVQYCSSAICQAAADTLITSLCLASPSDVACVAAADNLKACNA